jgi:hypothetical protein
LLVRRWFLQALSFFLLISLLAWFFGGYLKVEPASFDGASNKLIACSDEWSSLMDARQLM